MHYSVALRKLKKYIKVQKDYCSVHRKVRHKNMRSNEGVLSHKMHNIVNKCVKIIFLKCRQKMGQNLSMLGRFNPIFTLTFPK